MHLWFLLFVLSYGEGVWFRWAGQWLGILSSMKEKGGGQTGQRDHGAVSCLMSGGWSSLFEESSVHGKAQHRTHGGAHARPQPERRALQVHLSHVSERETEREKERERERENRRRMQISINQNMIFNKRVCWQNGKPKAQFSKLGTSLKWPQKKHTGTKRRYFLSWWEEVMIGTCSLVGHLAQTLQWQYHREQRGRRDRWTRDKMIGEGWWGLGC